MEEASIRDDRLVHQPHRELARGAAHDGTAHLGAHDGLLDGDLFVIAEGKPEGLVQLLGTLDLADAVAGSPAGRLHEEGVAAGGCDLGDARGPIAGVHDLAAR